MDYIVLEMVFFSVWLLVSVVKAAQLIVEEIMEDYICEEYVE